MARVRSPENSEECSAVLSVKARLKQLSLIAMDSGQGTFASQRRAVNVEPNAFQLEQISQCRESQFTRFPPEHERGTRKLLIVNGTGQKRDDWWNVTLRPFFDGDEVMDPSKPWRWKDLLDLIYAERFIENIPIDAALRFLANAGNALRVGGRIRLSTPSLEWVLKSHFSFFPRDLPQRLGDTFLINRAFYGWGHKFLYSKEMLQELMKQVGFKDIIFLKHGESDVEQLRQMEVHPVGHSNDGFDDAWIVEASRGEEKPAVGIWADAWLRESYTKYVDLQTEQGRGETPHK